MPGQEVPPETPLLVHIQPSGQDPAPDPLLETSPGGAVEELPHPWTGVVVAALLITAGKGTGTAPGTLPRAASPLHSYVGKEGSTSEHAEYGSVCKRHITYVHAGTCARSQNQEYRVWPK